MPRKKIYNFLDTQDKAALFVHKDSSFDLCIAKRDETILKRSRGKSCVAVFFKNLACLHELAVCVGGDGDKFFCMED